jgi:cysteine sulfinate desulfinase/cysteine desulfurase-like protein
MIRLPGYETVDTIYEGDNTIVFRSCWSESNEAVILKVLQENHSSPVDISR